MRRTLAHPSRIVALLFLGLVLAGTLLLRLPLAQAQGEPAPWLVALFTATSAVCVTGLAVVDTGTYWSPFGQVIVMLLFQLGGFGLMTAAALLGLTVNRSLRLRTRPRSRLLPLRSSSTRGAPSWVLGASRNRRPSDAV